MPVRRPLPKTPVVIPRSHYYSTGTTRSSSARHDYAIDDSLNEAEYFSNAVLEDNYDSARKSKSRDNELIRSTRAAIRHQVEDEEDYSPGTGRTGRSTKRFRSLPPAPDSRSPSPLSPPGSGSGALVPYRQAKTRASLSLGPEPTSLLSQRINSYFKGIYTAPSVQKHLTKPSISYKSYLVNPPSDPPSDTRSIVSYRSYVADPAISSPFSTRSSSKILSGEPRPLPYQSKRSKSVLADDDNGYGYTDDVDDYHVGDYKRRYRILNSPAAIDQYAAKSYSDDEEDDDDAETYSDTENYRGGTYSCPRPSGVSKLQLSSYDGKYDGSYDADMAEMYDYVPFGPSRHAILELTPQTSVTPSSITSFKPEPSPPPSSNALVTPSYKHLDDSLTKTSFANNLVFDSILASTASRAKDALAQTTLPEYKNASLVLSVEGDAVSEDGKSRYGFRYYPPPIPIKGSGMGLDERILRVTPKPISAADSFLCNYLDRLRGIRADIRDHTDNEEQEDAGYMRRGRSLASSYTPRSITSGVGSRTSGVSSRRLASSPSSTPTYSHRTIHMPVNISGRAHSVPVSSYRSRVESGQSHRVDVYPLVVSETKLPADKKLHLYSADNTGKEANKLTVLDKINIKAAIIGCRLDAEDGAKKPRKGPRSQFAANKLRELKIQDLERRYNNI